MSTGKLITDRWLKIAGLSALESAVMSMMVGTLGFVMAMYAAGALGMYGARFAIVVPLGMLALGARAGLRLWRGLSAEFARGPMSATAAVAAGFGVCLVALTYLGVLTPDSLGYDATWFHVKIAQDYARWGAIRPFLADYSHALPHLSSLIYTWAYLVPGLSVPERWLLVLHLEFGLFLWTLAGVSAVVTLAVGGPVRAAWASFFLLPGFFVNGLSGTADHVAAFFSIGAALSTLHACRTPTPRTATLLAMALAGALLTKYQGVYVLIPALVVVGVAWVYAWTRRALTTDPVHRRRELLAFPVVLLGALALLVSPHFIENAVFYRNPVYPFLQRVFVHSRPVVPNGWLLLEYGMKPSADAPIGTLLERLQHGLGVAFTVSGSAGGTARDAALLVLLLPAFLLAKRKGPLSALVVLAAGALLTWGATLNIARNLQTFMPVVAAAAGALIVSLWRRGTWARIGLLPLLTLQAATVITEPFQAPARSRLDGTLGLIQAGIDGKGATKLASYRESYVALGKAIPHTGKLLVHTAGDTLGIDRDIALDSAGFQGQISYANIHTPRELYDYFRSLGVTHLAHEPRGPYTSPSRQEDIVFHALVARYGVPMGTFGSYFLTAMPESPPPSVPGLRVLCSGLEGYSDGLYPIENLGTLDFLPWNHQHFARPTRATTPASIGELVDAADVVLCREECKLAPLPTAVLAAEFDRLTNRNGRVALYWRRVPSPG